MIVRTDAVILRSMKYRESSRIVTAFTRDFGKVSGIVKGARGGKNRFGGSLQPMSHVTLVMYRKEGRDLQTITQCDAIERFRMLVEDLGRMSAGMGIVELTHNVVHDEAEHRELFDLLVDVLSGLNSGPGHPGVLFSYYQLRLAGILGFRPMFHECAGCGRRFSGDEKAWLFDLDRGGLLCAGCGTVRSGHLVQLNAEMIGLMSRLDEAGSAAELSSLRPAEALVLQIRHIIERFLSLHLTGGRSLKSQRVFSRIIG